VPGLDTVVWGIAGQLSQRSVDVTKEHHILLVELDGLFSAVSYAFASVFAYPQKLVKGFCGEVTYSRLMWGS
jgi:hypothetical protein